MKRHTVDTILRRRMNIVLLFFFIAFTVLLARIFLLQIVDHRTYVDLAAKQHRGRTEITPERGSIFVQDRFGNDIPLAVSKIFKVVGVAPNEVDDIDEVVSALANTFKMDEMTIRKRIAGKDNAYEIIQRKVEDKIAQQLSIKNLDGVHMVDELRRVYPNGTLAPHILGFVGFEYEEEIGTYGLERRYNEELNGITGLFNAAEHGGFFSNLGRRIVRPPRNGAHIVLTIDYHIQQKAEEILSKITEKWKAASGMIVVVEPRTGKIRAMAALPTFDPNMYARERDLSVFSNPVVEASFELGSVLKPVTMAAALQEHVVSPETVYHDPGEMKIGGFTIKNFDGKSYGDQTMTQVLEKSLNTGMVFVARKLGAVRQERYFKKFGFGEKTNINLPGEINGSIANLATGRDVDAATASFGHGVAVTPIQAAMAIAAIANHGTLVKPNIVEEMVDDSGNKVMMMPEIRHQVITPETAEILTKMLITAIRNGYENRAGVKGYFVAGKTGTAQMPRRDRRGYHTDRFIHTFAGYAPAFNPKFLIYLQMNEPIGNRFAANTLTPAFHDLAEFMLNYYEVPPDEVEQKK